ncbi:hypothetical protein Tco_1256589 [Tanacetum coccineum]
MWKPKDILLLEAILNSEPLSPLPNHANYFPEVRKELKICEAKTDETSIDEPPEVELKDLPPHLEYAFLEEFCTHKILMEEDYTPAVQHQRRVNPKIHDVIKKEVEKLLNAGLIYPISDSPWLRMAGIMTTRKLNEATRKDHFPLPFMDQMLERLAGNEYYCFLDGFSSSFSTCLTHLEKMLKWCEDTNLALNWEKSHFMVKEGIVLGHKISKSGIENKCTEYKTDHSARQVCSLLQKDSKANCSDVLPSSRVFDLISIDVLDASTPWFADIVNYHAGNFMIKGMSTQQKRKFFKDVKHYFWEDPFLFKICAESVIRTLCFWQGRALDILMLTTWSNRCGHRRANNTQEKFLILDSFGPQFYKDAHDFSG